MQKVKSFFAYVLAALGLPVILITLMGSQSMAEGLANLTGLKISPWQNGGEVVQTLSRDGYRTDIYETVFDGLFTERRQGFVQIAWWEEGQELQSIDEKIDYDADGRADFRVQWQLDRDDVELTPLSEKVLGITDIFPLDEGLVIRVKIER